MQKPDTKRIIVIIFIIALASFFTQYAFNLLLAHHLPPSLYGDFYLGYRTMMVVSMLMLMGSDMGVRRFFPIYHASKNLHKMRGYTAWCLSVLAMTSALVFFINFLIGGIWFALKYFKLLPLEEIHILFYMLWLCPLYAAIYLLSAFLLSCKRIMLGNIFINIGIYIGSIIVFYLAFTHLESLAQEPPVLAGIFFLVLFLMLLLNLLSIFWVFPAKNFSLAGKLFVKNDDTHAWRKTAFRLYLNNVVFFVAAIADLALLELFGKTEAMVGYYSACLVIVGFIWIIVKSVQNFILVSASVTLENKQYHDLQKILNGHNFVMLIFVILTNLLLITFSKDILDYFGPGYRDAQTALIILLIAASINAMMRSSTSILLCSGHEKLAIFANLIAFFILVILGAPSAYFYGTAGTAAAVFISMTLYNFICFRYCRKVFPEIRLLTVI